MPERSIVCLLCTLFWLSPAHALYSKGFNCGDDGQVVADDGSRYDADRVYSAGNGSGRVSGTPKKNGGQGTGDMGGIVEPIHTRALLRSWTEGMSEYRFDVPPGRYLVSMHFIESQHHWSGLRRFDIVAEGESIVEDLDIFLEVDRRFAMNLRRGVTVMDGALNIEFQSDIGVPYVEAIHVERFADDQIAPPTPSWLSIVPSYRETILFWEESYERDQLGVWIWREDLTAGTPEELAQADPVVAARFVDAGLEAGHEYSYRLSAADVWGHESPKSVSLVATTLASIESPLPVHEFFMADEDLRWLNQNRRSDELLPADYIIDGELWEDIGVRYRGNTTRDLIKKNYKIRADNDDPFPPNRIKINLQSEWRVPSLLREKLAYGSFSLAGAPGSVADYVHLERNGRFIGAFLDIEQVDEYFLEERGMEGSVWKADTEAFAGDCRRLGQLSAYYEPYVLEVGTYDDYAYLDELFRVVNDTPIDVFRTEILDHLDVTSFMHFYAAQALVANWDHVIHNYYLFRDANTGRFEFIPWDLELGWDNRNQPIPYGTSRHRYFFLFYNRLYNRLMITPQYRRIYHVTLQELLSGPFVAQTIQAAIQQDHALLRPEMERDLYKPGWEDIDFFDSDLEALLSFATARRANILDQLSDWATDPTVNLFVNETVLTNVTGATDEAGDHDPWVEIHNFGNEVVDLSGLSLSDDPGQPTKWSFPAATTLAPGSHLLVWVDGEPGEGALHTSFRATPDTDALLISKASGETIDRIDLDGLSMPDVPVCRTPDAGASIGPMAVATPGAVNDPTPLVSVSLSAATDEYFPGDSVLVDLGVTNYREFSRSLELEIRSITTHGEQLLFEMPLELQGGEQFEQPLAGVIPNPGPAIPFTLEATLRDELGAIAHVAVLEGRIRDPRPITLVVNEIMASNDTTIADNADQFDDWIEIYNPESRAIDLDGLYLSDDLGNPRKWPIPSVVLNPGKHLVIWCDEDPEQGLLHASFKLSSGGEEVAIYDLDLRANGVIDRVVFPQLDSDVAFGRSPDGSPNLVLLPWPTPGESNP